MQYLSIIAAMINGLHHATLSVLDLERALGYFALGGRMTVERRWRMPESPDEPRAYGLEDFDGEAALLRGPNGFIELISVTHPDPGVPADQPVSAAGITHLCFQHQRMDELAGAFAEAGASFHAAPVALGTGYEYCYIRDPETNVLELEGNPVAPPPSGPWLSHVSISTADVERLSAFYGELVGTGVRTTGQYGGNPLIDRITRLSGTRVRMAWVDAGNLGLEIMQYLNPPTVARRGPRGAFELGYGSVCFEVDELAAELPRLEKAGVHLIEPLISYEDRSVAFGRDPDGNLLRFVEFAPAARDRSLDSLSDPHALRRADAAMLASRAKPQETKSS